MSHLIASAFLITLGFVAGILFERKNATKVEGFITEAQDLKAKGKAMLDALKGKK